MAKDLVILAYSGGLDTSCILKCFHEILVMRDSDIDYHCTAQYRLRSGGQAIYHLLYLDDLKLFAPSNLQLMELLKVIAPWRLPEFFERFQGRSDLIEFAKQENIPVSATPKEPWSTDENIMHIRLIQKNYEVVCYMADVGQNEDFKKAKEKAVTVGAKDVIVEDLRKEFVSNYMLPAVQMGLVYESRYYLGTSLARPCISVGLVNAAKKLGAKYISHGATGKGNDQVRFELSVYSLWPEGKVIAPWRLPEFFERFQGRSDLIEFAKQENIPVSATPKEPWSTDENIMHISYESGVLEDPGAIPPNGIFKITRDLRQAEDYPSAIDINFEKGLPVSVRIPSGHEKSLVLTDPLAIVETLNKLGGQHGVGRIDIVENRFLGLKSRGLYETPAGTVLHVAHVDLEAYALDKEVLRVKKYLQEKMADFVYNGFWFSPEAAYTRKCLEWSQEIVNGMVTVQIYKGNVTILARKSSASLYNKDLVSMDVAGGFSPEDSTGFININALRLKEYARFSNQAK